MYHRCASTLCWSIAVLALSSCSRTPARYFPPKYDAAALGAQAIAQLDTDGNHLLDAKELAAIPALLADLKKLDVDGDQRLSAAEIGGKVDEWTRGGVGAVAIVCSITKNGQPAAGVHVKFMPEVLMGDVVKSGSGITDSSGTAAITAEGQRTQGVMQCGYYRVELSLLKDGKETVPTKYNAHSTLVAEVRQRLEVALAFDIAN